MKLNKIRGYRVMIGLSQVYMANLLNISQYSYNRKELGITPFKDNEKIKIRDLFKEYISSVTLEELFF
ncbi:helix-turn-helix transcriptional regulator [uncultured Parvimonas sp.]|uniref:helix-turn-helix transcriptional regulator n=1 Tax=uncultured Parvimonas sp. TaxID=747372 RepID=UPI00061D87C6|nr:hypothetical protein [uncultured Parvimonas sp.]